MKKRMMITIGLCMTVVLGLGGCGSKNEKKTEINIGHFNNVTHAQALYMKAEGILEEALGDEMTVNWKTFNAGPAEVEGLFAGDIDIGYIGPVPAINANVKSKGDVTVLCGATKGGAVLVKRADAEIESVEDLSGKVVAIPQVGNTQHLSLLQLLSEHDLKPQTDGGTVKVSAVTNADAANMMERGDIDAALVPEPWGATLLGQGAELVLDYDEIYMQGDYDVAVVVVRTEFLEKYPEVVEAFLAAHEAASEAVSGKDENAVSIINKELETGTGKLLEEEIIKEAFTRIGISTEVNKEAMDGFAQIGKEFSFIQELPGDGLYAQK